MWVHACVYACMRVGVDACTRAAWGSTPALTHSGYLPALPPLTGICIPTPPPDPPMRLANVLIPAQGQHRTSEVLTLSVFYNESAHVQIADIECDSI